ncbi:MAG: hypothetical protein H6813_01165 [Phycisphaeraceae bacterium]|nr:hypothetical protein [Phycisphaeraceae bacterium]MCB9847304.1 hypothetical protein [Phycisphaeraceae bacterium]
MTNEHNHDFDHDNDDVFIAEADEFDDDLDAELPKWPKVVGIISIVWGSIGVICNGLGVASSFLSPMMAGSAGEGQMPPSVTDPPMTVILASVFGVLLSIFLVVAGVMTVLRRYAGRSMHLIYAPLHLISIVVGVMMQLEIQSQNAQWAKDNPDTIFAQQQQVGGIVGLVMLGIFTVIFLIWPVFCLVWFGLKKKTHQDMTGGVNIDSI